MNGPEITVGSGSYRPQNPLDGRVHVVPLHGRQLDLQLELEAIESDVRRLRPDWRDAEAFYDLRWEVVGRLTRLARQYTREPAPSPSRPVVPAPVVRVEIREVIRIVRVRSAVLRRPRHSYPRPPVTADQLTLALIGPP